MNALQQYANHFAKTGWTIGSMTDQQFVATKRKGMNVLVGLIGVVGLLFYLIPGLLILLLGYVARGTETKIVTETEARVWLAQGEQSAQKLLAQEEARKTANAKRISELSNSPLRFWYMMSSNQKMLLAGVIAIAIIVLLANLPS